MNVAVQRIAKSQVARPLKVLVPLISDELVAGNNAGLQHYCNAGDMLLEAREQLSGSSWTKWLSNNFALSKMTAWRYMNAAGLRAAGTRFDIDTTLEDIVHSHKSRQKNRAKLKPLHDAMDRVNVDRLANERQSREDEIKLHRDLAIQLIDLGYRAMATRLHPDRGGSRDAMSRLNAVRDELKSVAATRRFV